MKDEEAQHLGSFSRDGTKTRPCSRRNAQSWPDYLRTIISMIHFFMLKVGKTVVSHWKFAKLSRTPKPRDAYNRPVLSWGNETSIIRKARKYSIWSKRIVKNHQEAQTEVTGTGQQSHLWNQLSCLWLLRWQWQGAKEAHCFYSWWRRVP